MALFRIKTCLWRILPHICVGFAVLFHDIEQARQLGHAILEMFEQDPRMEAHHRITWKLLRPGSAFRVALEQFVQGTDPCELPIRFIFQVALFRYIPIAETTIEEKHARVALTQKGNIAPVRISLANRLPPLRRSL